jgi:chromosome segregation ATPase
MSSSARPKVTVPTTVIAEDSNTVMHELLYEYTTPGMSGASSQDFELQITDPENPILLFDYRLGAYDFPTLREEQQLLCEYSGFSNTVTGLLRAVEDSEAYHAVIDQRGSCGPTLLLQEVTKYKRMTHLRLGLIPASDARLKEFLCRETLHYKRSFLISQDTIENLRETLERSESESRNNVDSMKEVIRRKEEEFQVTIDKLQEKYRSQLEDQKQSSARERSDQQTLFEEKERLLVNKFEDQIADLRAELNRLNGEKGELRSQSERQIERISSLENQLSENKIRLQSCETENKGLQGIQTKLTEENGTLKAELASVSAQFEALKASLRETKELAVTNGTSIEELRANLARREAEIAQLQSERQELEKKASDRDWIAAKSKKVIEKSQQDIERLMKHHADRKAEWQAQLDELRKVEVALVRSEENVKALEQKIASDQLIIGELSAKVESLRQEIAGMKEDGAKKDQLNDYLQSELNKRMAPELLDLGDDSFGPIGDYGSAVKQFESPGKGGNPKDYVPQFHVPTTTTSLFESPLNYF